MHAHLRPAGDQMFDTRAWRGLAVVGRKTSRGGALRRDANSRWCGNGKHHASQTRPCRARYPGTSRTHPALRITKKVRAAIELMVSGDCKQIKDAAAKVGLARESLSRALSKPHVAEHLRMKVLRSLAMAAARAGAVKINLLDSDNAIARDRASSFVLGLAGIQPATSASLSVNIEVKAGYVIDLSDDPAPMRTIPHVG
jgi:hypothetical protein